MLLERKKRNLQVIILQNAYQSLPSFPSADQRDFYVSIKTVKIQFWFLSSVTFKYPCLAELPKRERKIETWEVIEGCFTWKVCCWMCLPDVVPLAVRLAVPHKAGASFVQELMALGTLEAGGVPLQVRRHSQDVLVVDLSPTAHTETQSPLF